MDKFKALDRLAALSEGMRDQFQLAHRSHDDIAPKGVWVSIEDAVWLTRAIRKRLKGGTLDQALGLTGSVGRDRSHTNDLMCQAWMDYGAPLAASPDQLKQIANIAWERFPKNFKGDAPKTRQMRNAIYKADGSLTDEALEVLSAALTLQMTSRQQK